MLEAVIWDFGGVLTTSPFEAFARFEIEHGLPADIIRRTNAHNHWENAWAKFERAEVDIETFDQLFAAESLALGAEVRGKDVLPLLSGDLRPEMVEALRRVGTSPQDRVHHQQPSGQCHRKQGRRIALYRGGDGAVRSRHRVGHVDPKRCVYLDDLGVNLKPARDMGMTTIKVLNAPQALADLEAATGLSLR